MKCSYFEVVPGGAYDCPPNRWDGYAPGTSGPVAHPLEARVELHGVHLCRACGFYLIELGTQTALPPKWPSARVMVAVKSV